MRIPILFAIFSFSLFAKYKLDEEFKGYFNGLNRPIVMDKIYCINCYGYHLKGSKAPAYEVKAENLVLKRLKERPRSEEDLALTKKYRTRWEDYRNGSYSRGHAAHNASFSYSLASQKAIFLMGSITPRNFQINNKIWNNIEKREGELAHGFQKIAVLNLMLYDVNPKRIKNHIAVPSFYVKISKTKDFEECYKVPDINVLDENINTYQVSCEDF